MTNVLRQELARAVLDGLEEHRKLRGVLLTVRCTDSDVYAAIAETVASRIEETLARYEHPVTR